MTQVIAFTHAGVDYLAADTLFSSNSEKTAEHPKVFRLSPVTLGACLGQAEALKPLALLAAQAAENKMSRAALIKYLTCWWGRYVRTLYVTEHGFLLRDMFRETWRDTTYILVTHGPGGEIVVDELRSRSGSSMRHTEIDFSSGSPINVWGPSNDPAYQSSAVMIYSRFESDHGGLPITDLPSLVLKHAVSHSEQVPGDVGSINASVGGWAVSANGAEPSGACMQTHDLTTLQERLDSLDPADSGRLKRIGSALRGFGRWLIG